MVPLPWIAFTAVALLALAMLFIAAIRIVALIMNCCAKSDGTKKEATPQATTINNNYSSVDFEMTVVQIIGDSDSDDDSD